MDQDRSEPSPAAAELPPAELLAGGLYGSGDDAGILGIDNVRLDLPVAGIGSRLLAVTLDQILIVVGAMLWMVLCLAVGMGVSRGGMAWVWVAAALGAFAIDFLYYTFCEIRMGGRTPGKSAVGLRTVNALGGQASPAAIAVRNAMRIFDYLVGVLMLMIDRRRRRLGDLVAGTLVVHEPPAEDETLVRRWPPGFSAREIALTETLLRRLPRLVPERSRELAGQYLKALRGRDPVFAAEAPGAPQADPVFELWRLFGVEQGKTSGEPER